MSSRLIFDAGGLFHGDGVCLVGRFVQHGGEAEKLAVAGLVDHHFLVVLVDRGHLDAAGQHNVSVHARIADLVDTLAGQRTSLRSTWAAKTAISSSSSKAKERDMFELDWVARHGSPQRR